MSYEADRAADRWFAQHAIECAEHFIVGAKVYRANKYEDKIEEGVVRRVTRCRIPSGSGDPVECRDRCGACGSKVGDDHGPECVELGVVKLASWEEGTHPYYVAEFHGGMSGWESQTYAWKFFWDEKAARKDLIRKLRDSIQNHTSDLERYVKKCENLITFLSGE